MSEEVGAGPDSWSNHTKGTGRRTSKYWPISSGRKAFFPEQSVCHTFRSRSAFLGGEHSGGTMMGCLIRDFGVDRKTVSRAVIDLNFKGCYKVFSRNIIGA